MVHRQQTVDSLRKFNARRKLKGAILTTMLATCNFSNRSLMTKKTDGIKESSDNSVTIEDEDSRGSPKTKEMNSTANGGSSEGSGDSNVTSIIGRTDHGDRSSRKQEIIKLTEVVTTAMLRGDFETFSKLVDPQMTCIQPESNGNLVGGLSFHRFYFDNVKNNKVINIFILKPYVHFLSDDAACIAYTRLTQYIDRNGVPTTMHSEETRVWQRQGRRWLNVHYHCSGSPAIPCCK